MIVLVNYNILKAEKTIAQALEIERDSQNDLRAIIMQVSNFLSIYLFIYNLFICNQSYYLYVQLSIYSFSIYLSIYLSLFQGKDSKPAGNYPGKER